MEVVPSFLKKGNHKEYKVLRMLFGRVVGFASRRGAMTAEEIAIAFTLRSLRLCERPFYFWLS